MFRVLARRSLVQRGAKVIRGGDHGPRMLPFARLAPPTEKMPEHADLVWDDGVAPEPAIDIELPNIPLGQVIMSQITMVLFLVGLYGLAVLLDPEDNAPVAPRRLALPTREEMDFDDDHGRARL